MARISSLFDAIDIHFQFYIMSLLPKKTYLHSGNNKSCIEQDSISPVDSKTDVQPSVVKVSSVPDRMNQLQIPVKQSHLLLLLLLK